MQIDIRRTSNYATGTIYLTDAHIELGFLSESETKDLACEFIDAAYELMLSREDGVLELLEEAMEKIQS